MTRPISRRTFAALTLPAAGLGAAAIFHRPADAASPDAAAPRDLDLDLFPRQPLSLAEKVVGLSHRDLKGVRELVEAYPALANAAHDWGFGDWETPLGAASHTGQTEIAEYLLSKGARADVFAFAALGKLDAVRTMIEAAPGTQRTLGPHGISLLRHARAGGEKAKPVLDYLVSLGDADPAPTNLPVTDAIKRPLMGTYAHGPTQSYHLVVGEGMGGLTIKREGGSAIRLLQQSPTLFVPSGAQSVRIAFTLDGDTASTVTITDHDRVVTATRVA